MSRHNLILPLVGFFLSFKFKRSLTWNAHTFESNPGIQLFQESGTRLVTPRSPGTIS